MRPVHALLGVAVLLSGALLAFNFFLTPAPSEQPDGPGGPSVPAQELADDGAAPAQLEASGAVTREGGEREAAVDPAAPEEREAVELAFEGDLAGRISGRVESAAGTPGDELCYVVALEEAMGVRRLYARNGPLEQPVSELGELPEGALARGRVEADGSFQLDLPEGTSEAFLAVHARYQYSLESLPVPAGEMRHNLVMYTQLGGRIVGSVELPAGASYAELEGLQAEIGPDLMAGFNPLSVGQNRWPLPKEIEPDANGRFEINGIPADLELLLFVREERHVHVPEQLEALAEGEERQVRALLSPGATLSGRVVDESGVGIAEIDIDVHFGGVAGEIFDELREVETDEQGDFLVQGAPWGRVSLRIWPRDYMPGRWTINVEEGEHKRDIELVLEAGAEITGVVRFLDGAPASGVKLNARLDMAALGGPAAMTAAGTQDGSARTDAEGRFTMDGLGELAYVVRAQTEIEEGEHVGSWSAIQRGVNPGGEPLALVLEPRLDLRGLVTDLDEQPVSEFEVLATLQGSGGMLGLGAEREDASFDASEDGSFTLEGLSKGSWEIRVDAEGFALSGQQVAVMPEAASAPPLLFTLTPAAKVAGRVIDQNGAPVPAARVEVVLDLGARISAAGSGGGPAVLCDQEGVFLLEDLDPGMLSIRALHDGYAASEEHALELAPGQLLEGIELALRSGAIVTGEVLDQNGEPAEGRTVMVQSMPSYTTQHMMTSESGGEFRFENLEPGQWQLISMGNVFDNEAQSGDMAGMMGDMLIEILELEDGEELHVVLGALAEDPVRLSCQVLLDGEPVEGLIVSLAPEDGEGFSDLKMAFTDGEGMFNANLDHPGTYLTSVQRNNGGTQQTTVEFQVHVPEGVEEHATTIELPVGRITGRVTDDRGEPLPDCRVSLQVDGGIRHGSFLGGNYVESATDADGAYSLDWLRPGTYSVAAGGAALGGLLGDDPRAGRTMQSDIAVSEGQWLDGVDFQLGRPGELHGLVRRADGMPAVGATIFIRNADGGLMERFSFITTDTAGRFRYPGLSPGYYTASAKLGSESSQESSQAQVLSDAPGNVDILLEAGTLLLVSVIDNTGAEVRATVSVRDDDGHEWTGMSSFSELLESYGAGFSSNEQRVGPVPAGSYDIEVLTNDGRRGRKPITVSGQAERKVKVRLR